MLASYVLACDNSYICDIKVKVHPQNAQKLTDDSLINDDFALAFVQHSLSLLQTLSCLTTWNRKMNNPYMLENIIGNRHYKLLHAL